MCSKTCEFHMFIHVLFECHRAHWFYHQEANPWKRFEQTEDLNADNFKHGLGLVQWAHHERKSNEMREQNAKFQYGSNLDWLDARLALQATCSILWWNTSVALINTHATKTMMMKKLNEEWKWERSQQIKFPLDGIILTAYDIKQVFYVHRTVKFIHAHICTHPVLLFGCDAEAFTLFSLILFFHNESTAIPAYRAPMFRFWLLRSTWFGMKMCMYVCVCPEKIWHEWWSYIQQFSVEKLTPCHAHDFDE